MTKTKTKRTIWTVSIILVALLVGAAIFYFSWQRSQKENNLVSKDQVTEKREEPESGADWEKDSLKELGEEKIIKDSATEYLYSSKDYQFGFNFNQISVTWNALTSSGVKNIIQLSFYNNGAWSDWKSYNLELASRDTLYSTGDISSIFGSRVKFRLVAESSSAKINDFSLVVGGERVDDVFIREISFND